MRYRKTAILTIVLQAFAQGAFAEDRAALIIGISQYENLSSLEYADSDAKELDFILRTWGGYRDECVTTLTNREATNSAIRSAFRDFVEHCQGSGATLDSVLIYYSGHAVRASDEGGHFIKQGVKAREFLAPHDAHMDDTYLLGDKSTVNDSFLKKEWFASRLSALPAKNISVVLDSCHSGMPDLDELITVDLQMVRRDDTPSQSLKDKNIALYDRLDSIPSVEEIGLLAATNEIGRAKEFPELEHGALSFAIIQTIHRARSSTKLGEYATIDLSSLFDEVMQVFRNTKVEGNRRLIEYHEPKLFLVARNALAARGTFARFAGSASHATVAALSPETDGAGEKDPAVADVGIGGTSKMGTLRIQTIPTGAEIWIDGKEANIADGGEVRLVEGHHLLVVRPRGSTYRHVVPIEVRGNDAIDKVVDLYGSVRVTSHSSEEEAELGPDITISIDGNEIGTTNSISRRLVSGTYKLTVKYGDVVKDRDIAVRPDSPLHVKFLIKSIQDPPEIPW